MYIDGFSLVYLPSLNVCIYPQYDNCNDFYCTNKHDKQDLVKRSGP